MIAAHKTLRKVRALAIHQVRRRIYSVGDDKRICVTDLISGSIEAMIKCSGFKPKTAQLHQETDRLYVSMCQGVIFAYDVSKKEPIILRSLCPNVQIS